MSVPASKKQKSKAEFMTNGQHLLIDIGNWVDSQKAVGKTTALDDFFNLASRAYINMSYANNIRIINVDTYSARVDGFRKAKAYYRALREYLTVIGTMYQIKKSRKRDWSDCLYFVDIEIDGVIKSDLKVLQRVVGKFNKTANTINKMLDDYNNRQLKKRAAQQRWRTKKLLEDIEEGQITENRNPNRFGDKQETDQDILKTNKN